MKNLFLLIAFLGATAIAKTQGNLQFNQVKLVSTVETVPAGKVWKVESATHNGGAPFCVSSNETGYCGSQAINYKTIGLMSFTVNSQSNIIFGGQINNGNFSSPPPFPLWLPAGTTLAAGTNLRYLSVIEFNVVP